MSLRATGWLSSELRWATQMQCKHTEISRRFSRKSECLLTCEKCWAAGQSDEMNSLIFQLLRPHAVEEQRCNKRRKRTWVKYCTNRVIFKYFHSIVPLTRFCFVSPQHQTTIAVANSTHKILPSITHRRRACRKNIKCHKGEGQLKTEIFRDSSHLLCVFCRCRWCWAVV